MKKKMRPADTELPKYLADAMRRAWPDGVVEMGDWDDAQLQDRYSRLAARLSCIPEVDTFLYGPGGVPMPPEGSDEEREFSDWDEESRSYALFFLSPYDERFQFETDTLEPDEDGIERRISGKGRFGCVVAVSAVAPFAAVCLDQMEEFDSGSRSEPDIEPHMFNLDGGKLDVESHFQGVLDDAEMLILRNLRAGIIRVLEESGMRVIPEADLDRLVPWLRAGEEVVAAEAGDPVTVRQAFFFRCL